MHTGPKIVKNGLIFGYDTGYPQVSTNDDYFNSVLVIKLSSNGSQFKLLLFEIDIQHQL